jgi:predicted RNase H-like nuclease (RuvC/YqgF family)
MIIETNFTEDSTALSSTVETLEAENRNLKSQLASMMELLEETDASVAYLQEALKRDETSTSQPKTHRSKRKPTSYRRSRQKPVHRSAE